MGIMYRKNIKNPGEPPPKSRLGPFQFWREALTYPPYDFYPRGRGFPNVIIVMQSIMKAWEFYRKTICIGFSRLTRIFHSNSYVEVEGFPPQG